MRNTYERKKNCTFRYPKIERLEIQYAENVFPRDRRINEGKKGRNTFHAALIRKRKKKLPQITKIKVREKDLF